MLNNSIIPIRQLHGELRKLKRIFPRVFVHLHEMPSKLRKGDQGGGRMKSATQLRCGCGRWIQRVVLFHSSVARSRELSMRVTPLRHPFRLDHDRAAASPPRLVSRLDWCCATIRAVKREISRPRCHHPAPALWPNSELVILKEIF